MVTNEAGSDTSDIATLTVQYKPVIKTPPKDQAPAVGSTATFTVAAQANPSAMTYQWQYRTSSADTWTDITGATSSTYTTPAATTSMDGYQYRCVVSNSIGDTPSSEATLKVQHGRTLKKVNLDASVLKPADGTWDAACDHKLWFGAYSGRQTAFRILTSAGGKLLIDSDRSLLNKRWVDASTANAGQASGYLREWKGSDIELWLNGDDYYGSSSVFTEKEKAAIAQTSLSAASSYKAGVYSYLDYAADDYVFLLSAKEADTLYPADSVRKKRDTGGSVRAWWLRSGYSGNISYVGDVAASGAFGWWPSSSSLRFAPAMNLDQARVLLITPATNGKPSSTGFAAVADDDTTRDWKATVLDESRTFAVTDKSKKTVTSAGGTFSFSYTGAKTGTGEWISAVLVNPSGEAAYYGKLKSSTNASGSVSVTIPSNLPEGLYTLKIFNEQINADKVTDYASAFS